MSHSPEPWTVVADDKDVFVRDADGHNVMTVVCGLFIDEDRRIADMYRIIACVNACRGIPTEDLVKHGAAAIHEHSAKQTLAAFHERGPALMESMRRTVGEPNT